MGRGVRIALVVVALGLGACGGGEEPAGTTTTAAAGAKGQEFRDPQGAYAMTIGSSWTRLPGSFVAEVEAWAVGQAIGSFTPNVNVLTQEFPGESPSDYIEFTGAGGGGIEVQSGEVVRLPDGRSAARFVMSQVKDGTTLRSLGLAVTRRGTAVLATLTAPRDDFDRFAEAVEPYLQTLRLLDAS